MGAVPSFAVFSFSVRSEHKIFDFKIKVDHTLH